jgi:glucoamylase
MEKYLNEAIIGNKNVLATFTGKGELQRLYFPGRSIRQYIDFSHIGVKINDSNLIYLHDDINNIYKQYYDVNTNILNTEITNTYFNLKILQTDFIPIKENVLIRRFTLINENSIDLDVKFLIHQGILWDTNNFVGCKLIDNGMTQYAHDFMISTFSKDRKTLSHQIHGSKNNIKSGEIWDKDYIGMSNDSSISYNMEIIKPGEKKQIDILVVLEPQPNEMEDLETEIERIRRIDINSEYAKTKAYWRKYVKTHDKLKLKEPKNSYEEKIVDIYYRSILLFPLLTNCETGGIIASAEIDENFDKCGRYAYTWPRDAVFITRAMDVLGMKTEVDKFYKVFCKKTQSKDGKWEQRFFADTKLAPCWGYQIDETASVIYGVYSHYEYTKDEKFLKDTLPMCEKAVDFLKRYVKDIFEGTQKYHVSYDLWEMCEGIHLYSLASIYAAFDTMLKIYKSLGKNVSDFENNRLKDEKIHKSKLEIEKLLVEVKKYINDNMYDEGKKSYVRNASDKKIDISLIGAVIPFKVFTPKEKKVLNTVERITLSLRTYTGGFQRFEGDHYMNGNPWPIANMWMTLYYLEKGEKTKAKETFDFVIKTVSKLNLIGEQVDNNTLKANWVIGLGWSHAMFVLVLEKMLNG